MKLRHNKSIQPIGNKKVLPLADFFVGWRKKKKCTREICQRLIDTHKDRIKSKGEYYFTPAQRNIFQAVTDLVRTSWVHF
jgi:hypothetical protein